jgi:transposase-like protein
VVGLNFFATDPILIYPLNLVLNGISGAACLKLPGMISGSSLIICGFALTRGTSNRPPYSYIGATERKMAKIPQGEWSAIAERYSQGESISSIARYYGCTAPAIHYILKRNKERSAVAHQPPALSRTPTKARPAQPARINGSENARSGPTPIARKAPMLQVTLPTKEHRPQRSDREFAPLLKPVRAERSPTAGPPPERGKPQRTRRASALTARLDAELHADVEAAILAFRSSFDAALADNSPVARERLRQAASDLMRVAARTTIVLDRLNSPASPARPRD